MSMSPGSDLLELGAAWAEMPSVRASAQQRCTFKNSVERHSVGASGLPRLSQGEDATGLLGIRET